MLLDDRARERLDALVRELEETERELSAPDVADDPERLAELGRRHRELERIVSVYRAWERAVTDSRTAREMLAEATGEDRDIVREELNAATGEAERLAAELRELLIPADPNAGRDVIVEIRGAEGGEEANLFARDLFEMYRAWAARRGWDLEVLSATPSDQGGYNEITFVVRGDDAWTRLKHEGGPHRVQRVPVTESAGRIHTSSATVTVLPEADEVDVELDPADLEIEVFRARGPGGQSVNTTDSAVRITHRPTGIVVAIQDTKSQRQNREQALRVLRSRLLQAERERQAAEISSARRSQIGSGGRAEKIRTYNFRENRVTDHRIGLTVHKLDRVLAGELDEIVDALLAEERARQLAEHADDAAPAVGPGA